MQLDLIRSRIIFHSFIFALAHVQVLLINRDVTSQTVITVSCMSPPSPAQKEGPASYVSLSFRVDLEGCFRARSKDLEGCFRARSKDLEGLIQSPLVND